jgi:hypothetical protein
MKRWTSALLALLLLCLTAPAGADPGHERPKITTFKFAQPNLNAGIDEVLIVTAHDPNSWIYEVDARWEDADHNGGVLFADTFCVQDLDFSDPGTPAKLKLPVQFEHPGEYHVEVRAISAIKCQGGNHQKNSKTLEMDVVVGDPLSTESDPNDASGAFDISSLEETQASSETSATTEIVQRIVTYDAWTNDQLAGPAFFEMYFDLDGHPTSIERILTIDLNEQDGSLRASTLDPYTGQSRGYAAVSRPDDKTLEVRIPPLLLKKGVSDYGWYAYADSGAPELCAPDDPCVDTAPDEGMMRHRL